MPASSVYVSEYSVEWHIRHGEHKSVTSRALSTHTTHHITCTHINGWVINTPDTNHINQSMVEGWVDMCP